MLEFILGYLFGENSKKYDEKAFEYNIKNQIQKSKYVPKFGGYYRNEGTLLNEDWHWIEPKFKKRYLNIYRLNTKTILKGGWTKDKAAEEIFECDDQRDLELQVKCYRSLAGNDSTVIYENEKQLVYLNVELETNVTISIDTFKKDNCRECISCLDFEEAEEVLIDMKNHYISYRTVEIRNNI